VQVSVQLSDLTVSCLGEITRRFPREDARTELSVRFVGMSEHDQDEVRRRIFDRLRDLRRRGLI
jgi:c-di-GMP-binding flagellar brake protein YcgR